MSSSQCYKPCEQTNYYDNQKVDKCHDKTKDHKVDNCHDKTKNHQADKCHDKNKDHSITHKVKEITDSAKNFLISHHGADGAHNGHLATHKPSNGCSTVTTHNGHSAHKTEKKKTEGHCLPKLNGHGHGHAGHIKKKKKNKGAKPNDSCSDSSSDSSSDSDNDNESCKKKNSH